MDTDEAMKWVSHAKNSMEVSGDQYGAEKLAEAVDALRSEFAALKEAARPVVKVYIDAKNNQIWSGATVTGETMALPGVTVAQLDNLARLCGEE